MGLTLDILEVATREASTINSSRTGPSLAAKRAFFFNNVIFRIWFPTGLVSRSRGPSSQKLVRPGYFATV